MFVSPTVESKDRDPHIIHEKILLAAKKAGFISLNNRGLSYVPSAIWGLNGALSDNEHSIHFESVDDRDHKWWEDEPISRLSLLGNSIKDLPGHGIAQLNSLIILDVRHNELTGLPEEIAQLSNLKQLLLSSNHLATLPKSLTLLTTLVLMDLAHNRLSALPEDMSNMAKLEHLDVSDNRLDRVPLHLSPALTILNVAQNRLVCLPQGWIQSCPLLCEFNASNNVLEELGITEDPKVPHLSTLNLHKNHICSIPSLTAFPKLKCVHFGGNCIELFNSKSFQGLSDLSILEFSQNRIKIIPEDIPIVLPNLARLDLSDNDIRNIPLELGFMESLNVLALSNNPIRSIGRDVMNSGTEAIKALLRERYHPGSPHAVNKLPSKTAGDIKEAVSTNPYDDLPPVIVGSGCLDWRRETKSNKEFRFTASAEAKNMELPPLHDAEAWKTAAFKGCGANAEVRTLNLSARQLDAFPMGIMAFQHSLMELNVSFNNLTQLPNDIDCLSRLKELILSNNALTALPPNLSKLSMLSSLVLDFNPGLGPELPSNILFVEPLCRSLQVLSARGCRLTRLPPSSAISAERMAQLQTLDFSDNDISALEPELGLCTQLQNLHVAGNTFRIPRPAIVAKGTTAILEYLRSRIVH